MLDCLHIYLTNLPIAQLVQLVQLEKNTYEASFFRRRNFG